MKPRVFKHKNNWFFQTDQLYIKYLFFGEMIYDFEKIEDNVYRITIPIKYVLEKIKYHDKRDPFVYVTKDFMWSGMYVPNHLEPKKYHINLLLITKGNEKLITQILAIEKIMQKQVDKV